jgi:hypothetical protein
MSFLFEGRGSDSPYVEAVWRGRAGSNYAPVCPASNRWHLLFLRQNGRVTVSVEGPLTKATPVTQVEGTEWFGVTFPLGAFLPSVSIRNLLDEQAILFKTRSFCWAIIEPLKVPNHPNKRSIP